MESEQLTSQIEEIKQLLREAIKKANSSGDIVNHAEMLVDLAKRIDRLVYQLAFVATSQGPLADIAGRLLDTMAQQGLVTKGYVAKAIEDVRRWRERLALKWL